MTHATDTPVSQSAQRAAASLNRLPTALGEARWQELAEPTRTWAEAGRPSTREADIGDLARWLSMCKDLDVPHSCRS